MLSASLVEGAAHGVERRIDVVFRVISLNLP